MRLVELQDGFIDYSSPNRIVLSEAEKKRYLLKIGIFCLPELTAILKMLVDVQSFLTLENPFTITIIL